MNYHSYVGPAVLIVVASTSAADIINIPGDQPTIQAGIDAAVDGDEVVVAPGTYLESIDFLGKAIWLRSSAGAEVTTIDGTGNFHVVACGSGEGSNTVLDGFTITGGNANGSPPDDDGGGMFNSNGSSPTVTNCTFSDNAASFYGGGMRNANSSSPTVTNCTFQGNTADRGGGMSNGASSSPTVTNCTFIDNSGTSRGGGMRNVNGSIPTVTDCRFEGNTASDDGGGMSNSFSSPTVTNCTFEGNTADRGGGMSNGGSSSPTVTNCTFSGNIATIGGAVANFGPGMPSNPTLRNCVLWENNPDEIFDEKGSEAAVVYSDVQGGFAGTGNINTDPLFVDADLRLGAGSPCIDAGDNTAVPVDITTDLDGNTRFVDDPDTIDTGNGDSPVVDMGAYEFQGAPCPWDLDIDGLVGINDLLALLAQWGTDPVGPPDFDGDGNVGITDFLELLANWGPCI